MVKAKRIRIRHELLADGFIAWLWIVKGVKITTAYDYAVARSGNSYRIGQRYRREFKNFISPLDELDKDFNLVLFALGYNVVNGLVKLSDLEKKYKGVLSPHKLRREFRWWCWQRGIDPRNFYRTGYKKTGYWVPREFVEYIEQKVLPMYLNRPIVVGE